MDSVFEMKRSESEPAISVMSGGVTPSEAGDGAARKQHVVSIVLDHEDIHPKTKKPDGREGISKSQFAGMVSGVYVITMIAFGILFPMTEALQDIWLQSIPNGIFLMWQYVAGTAFLMYTQLFLLGDHDNHEEAEHPATHEANGSTSPGRTPSSPRVPRVMSHAHLTTLTTSASDGDLTKGMSPPALLENGAAARLPTSPSFSERRLRRTREVSTSSSSQEQQENFTVSLDLFQSVFEHEGSSFYLRLGTLMFGIGNLIYIGLEIEYFMGGNAEECNEAIFGWTFIFRGIFIITQSFFIFKNPRVHITKHIPLAKFGFMHLIALNLCIWIRTLTNEIQLEMKHSKDHEDDGLNVTSFADLVFKVTSSDEDNCSSYRDHMSAISPYLFPFVMEYSLIATGIMAIFYQEISAEPQLDVMQNIKHVLKNCGQNVANLVPGSNGYLHNLPSTSAHTPMPTGVHFQKSHRGTMLGFVLLSGILVAIILFFYKDGSGDHEQAHIIYLTTDIVLHLFALSAVVLVAFQMSKLSFVSKNISVDDTLLFIAMAGSFLFEMALLISTSTYVLKLGDGESYDDDGGSENHGISTAAWDEDPEDYIIILGLVSSVLAGTHSIIQLLVLLAGLRMYSATKKNLKEMPGRGTVTFLIIANITLWIFRTMQVKQIELGIQEDFFGLVAWLFIMNICLPLQLFFFFHSSVCFADIWSMAYKPIEPTYHRVAPDTPQTPGMQHSASYYSFVGAATTTASPVGGSDNQGFSMGGKDLRSILETDDEEIDA